MENAKLKVHADYPGGNIKLIAAGDGLVRVEQDLRATTEWWFYWSFRAESHLAQEIVFEFCNGNVVGPWGPAVSKDRVTWQWLGDESLINRHTFRYTFEADEAVYFSFSLPYQLTAFERFITRCTASPCLHREQLTVTRQGRSVPLLMIGDTGDQNHVICTCRHHACESTASYVLEGLLSHLLQDGAKAFRDRYLVHVVPFVDLDGVEAGDQGKSRAPHDHNRDYIEEPLYETTAAIMRLVERLHPIAGIDFHSPFMWGERHDYPYFVKQSSPIKEEIERLGELLRGVTGARHGGAIRYTGRYDIEMGEEWNQPSSPTSSAFMRKAGARLACGFEVPYFGTEDQIFNQENCRQFGADFAKALMAYLGNV